MPEPATESETHEPTSPEPGFIGRIPVRNIWLLMFYASELYRQRGANAVGAEDNPDDIAELAATILTDIVARRLMRNLTSGYRSRHKNLTRVRGRIDLLTTERHQLLSRGTVSCRFEELTVNTPRNRYVRAALLKAGRLVKPKISSKCRTLAGTLDRLGVDGQPPSRSELVTDQNGRHNKDDRMMIAAADLVFNLAIPTEIAGRHALPGQDREEYWVRLIFEKAVAGFYNHTLPPRGWQVSTGRTLKWEMTAETENISSILPRMVTDIWLEHPFTNRRIIIDTKFTNIFTTGRYGAESLKSGYIYQLYAYLRAQEQYADGMSAQAVGIFLHPSIDRDIRESAVIHGHKIKFNTVNLTVSAQKVREQLVAAVR